MVSTKRQRLRRRSLIVAAVAAAAISIGLLLELGAAPHQVTRYEAEKIALTYMHPGDHARIQSKLIREWQLTLLNRNDGGNVWSNDLIWLVLVPGGNVAPPGPCCGAPPEIRWTVAMVMDQAGYAQLDGYLAGVSGDAPAWWGFLPDLSGGR